MKKLLFAFSLCLLILLVSGCDSKREPHLTKVLSYNSYYSNFPTLEEKFSEAAVIVSGKIVNGNKTYEEQIELEQNNSFSKKYVVAEVEIEKVYKGDVKEGEIISVQQEYGESSYVKNGYLKYKSDYILFFYDMGDYYQLLLPSCRTEIVNGKFAQPLNSETYGIIDDAEKLADYVSKTEEAVETKN